MLIPGKQKGHALGIGFPGFFAAAQGVGSINGGVELLVGFEQGGWHGERVVQVGQAAAGVLGTGIEYGLGGFFYGKLGFVGCGCCGQVGPGEVVVNDVFGVAVTAFQTATNSTQPNVVHGAGKNTKVQQGGPCRHLHQIAA